LWSTALEIEARLLTKNNRRLPMKLLPAAALLAAIAAYASPALAKEDCSAGFKTHIGKMTVFIEKVTGGDLASAVQKSIDAYNSCMAGDNFSPHGVWDQVLADMESKAKGAK
jgi:hypothetical protein